jgi:hypothetical protein
MLARLATKVAASISAAPAPAAGRSQLVEPRFRLAHALVGHRQRHLRADR